MMSTPHSDTERGQISPRPFHLRRAGLLAAKAFVAGCLLLLFSVTAARAEVTLNTYVKVTGSIVTVGDLFEGISPAKAERSVTAAPVPGRTLTLNTSSLVSVARANGIDWKPASVYVQARIERASRQLRERELSDQLVSALPPVAHSAMGDTSIKLDNPNLKIYVPDGQSASIHIDNMSYDNNSRRFRATVQLRDSRGRILGKSQVAGQVVTTVSVPVLTHPMRNGDIIRAQHVDWIDIEMDSGAERFIFDADSVIGKTPRRVTRPGVPLRGFDLVAPTLVERGSQVTMLYETGSLQITAKGRALADGAEGELVRVVNLTSSRTVEAIVEKEGVVRLGPAPSPVAVQTARGTQSGPFQNAQEHVAVVR